MCRNKDREAKELAEKEKLEKIEREKTKNRVRAFLSNTDQKAALGVTAV
jgi:hypothetical protein